MIGVSTLIKNVPRFARLANHWPGLALSVIAIGFVVVVFVIIAVSETDRQLARARRQKRTFQIMSSSEGDTVVIDV